MLAAADKLRLWREKPHVFVREVFNATPDGWQDEALAIFPTQPRIAMKACKGPGKTCLLAWLCWNFLLTRPHPKIAATAISGDNLKDNLWPEMATWQNKSALLKEAFRWNAERINNKEHPETWWMSARTWSRSANAEQQGNTLAGLHANYVMIVLDESGGIPDAVMANAEGIGSSAVEWHIVQAGNPTHLSGPLYRACTTERSLWHVIEITSDPDNPKRTSRVAMQWAREQIQKYGADHPWVLVNVFGKFPPASFNSLIGPDEVNAVLGRHIHKAQYMHAAKTIGIDVGRFGDDPSVIFPRQGLACFKPIELRNVTGNFGAGAVARLWNEHPAGGQTDGVFIDGSGGWAASWIDALSLLSRVPIEVQFAGKPNDPKYYNKRAEIWFEMCDAIKSGMCLPNLPEIVAELTTPQYTFKGDKILIEEKDQVKLRLGRSPNYADALATTFAQPVHVQSQLPPWAQRQAGQVQTEYDPFASERV
jgi:phage terminase large subunit